MQIPVKCFDLVSLRPGDLKWNIDMTPSFFLSGTSTTNPGGGPPRPLHATWMKTRSPNL